MAGTARSRPTDPTDPGVVRLVRLENHEHGAHKAYAISVEREPDVPGRFRCRAEWGPISGRLTEQVKASGDPASCERALEGLLREKQRGGYRVVSDTRASSPAASPAAGTPPRPATRGEAEGLQEVLARRRREATWSI